MNIKNMQLLISIQLKDYKDYQTVISFLEVIRVYPETINVLQICVITLIPWHHNIICVFQNCCNLHKKKANFQIVPSFPPAFNQLFIGSP